MFGGVQQVVMAVSSLQYKLVLMLPLGIYTVSTYRVQYLYLYIVYGMTG